MPKQTKLSPIWDYYTETDDPKYAQCKIYKEKKSLGSNNPCERTLANIKIPEYHRIQDFSIFPKNSGKIIVCTNFRWNFHYF